MERSALTQRSILPRLGGVTSAVLFVEPLFFSHGSSRVLGGVGIALSLGAIFARGVSGRRRSAAAIIALLAIWGGLAVAYRPYVLLFVLPALVVFALLSSPLVARGTDSRGEDG